MSLAGMLVEYLITGCSALVWIWIILLIPGVDLPPGVNARELEAHQIALFVPVLYVLGLFIDYLAKGLTDFLDETVRQRFWRPATKRLSKLTQESSRLRKWLDGPKDYDSAMEYAEIFFHSPDLGKQLELRSTRDRVARGALFNTLLIGVTLAWYSNKTGYSSPSLVITATFLVCWIWFLIWLRLHRLTDKYHAKAGEAVERDHPKSGEQVAQPGHSNTDASASRVPAAASYSNLRSLRSRVDEAKRDAILSALRETDGNKQLAAKRLDISLPQLYQLIKDLAVNL